MNGSSHQSAPRAVALLCGIVAAIALLVLVGGWLLNVGVLRAPIPRWSPMAPLTAVLLLLASGGSSQLERRPILSAALLIAASILAGLVLAAYFTGGPPGVQQVTLFFRRGAHTPLPELPAPDTAASFILLSLALGCMRTRHVFLHDVSDVVAVFIATIGLQVLIAYSYNIAHSSSLTGYRQIAPHSTVAVILLAGTVVAHRPTPGIFNAMTGGAQSALLLRRLLPVTVFSCALMGLLTVEAIRAKVGGNLPEIIAWSVTGAMVVIALLLFVSSAEMRKAEAMVHRREQDLMAAHEAAEAASDTKSRFMAVMSHELRTPLTAMLGYADLLDAGIAGELGGEARKFVERIRSSGWHLVGLIDAVLLYASGQPAGEQARRERVDLAPLIIDVARSFEAQARAKGIALDLVLPKRPELVVSEQSKLREILVNLVSNAVKFTERGSVTIAVSTESDDVVIEIRDTGIGIDQQQLSRIWQPFEQADDPHTRVHGGMGLGMALTRMLSDQLGVRLDVSSVVGEGTSFRLALPAARDNGRPGEIQLDGKDVLVVDDDPAVLRIMSRALGRYGAAISEARSAQEALEWIAGKHRVDVIVTDISMPGMSGIEFARTLGRPSGIPVLFVTGAELSSDDRDSIAALGGQLLYKPFEMSELARAVQRLGSKRPGNLTARSGAPPSSSSR